LKIQLLFFWASFLLSLAGGELVLRWFPSFDPQPRVFVGDQPDRPNANFLADPELGWRMRPGHEFVVDTPEYRVAYRSNDRGFRAPERSQATEADRTIALVGDSFAFGQGVAFDQSFGALLEAGLAGTRVENLALPGYGLDQMWLATRSVALPMQPALVIVAFISEDFTRSLNAWRRDAGMNKPTFRLEAGDLVRMTPEDAPPAWVRFLETHSRLWTGTRQAMRLLGHRLPVGEWWDLNRAILDAIRADAREADTRVLFVYLPTRERRSFASLPDYMASTGASFLDLGNQPPPEGLNFPEDGHLNPAGHRFVADALLAWVDREMPALRVSPRASASSGEVPEALPRAAGSAPDAR
jgi:lysophospholipase L1-like esterase